MGNRRSERVLKMLPARVFGMDAENKPFTLAAQTIDVSLGGARIADLGVEVKVGEIIGVQHGLQKARFRVIWTGNSERNDGQVGLGSLEPITNIWGLAFSVGGPDDFNFKLAASERRRRPRYLCNVGLELRTKPDSAVMYVRCTEISQSGCYIETASPFPIGARLHLRTELPTGILQGTATVRTSHPAFGMGLQFISVSNVALLDNYLCHLSGSASPALAMTEADLDVSGPVATIEGIGGEPRQVVTKFAPTRVMLAEDSKFFRIAYMQCLERAGMQVMVAADGEEAFRIAKAESPDIVVLDLLMPKLGGLGVLRLLKRDPLTSNIPVIILSGLPRSNETKLLSDGAAAYLVKTDVGPEELVGCIVRTLFTSRQSPALQPSWLSSLSSDR